MAQARTHSMKRSPQQRNPQFSAMNKNFPNFINRAMSLVLFVFGRFHAKDQTPVKHLISGCFCTKQISLHKLLEFKITENKLTVEVLRPERADHAHHGSAGTLVRSADIGDREPAGCDREKPQGRRDFRVCHAFATQQ